MDFADRLIAETYAEVDAKSRRACRGSMASLPRIANYWRENGDVFPNLVSHIFGWDEPFCFRCGWLAPMPDGEIKDRWVLAKGWLERAHLQDHILGGPGTPENLVPLCGLCHYVMPRNFAERDPAIAWINSASRHTLAPGWNVATHNWFGGSRFCEYPGYRRFAAAKLQFLEEVRIGLAEFRDRQNTT